MPLFFANPLGFLALLGLPAIILIHYLQRESRRVPISTLFLLDAIDRQALQGRRFYRLRHSIPLWLQLLGILLFTWLLVEPGWKSTRSVHRIVLVLDNSASIGAFQKEVRTALTGEIPPLASYVGTTEYSLIESSIDGKNLYRGLSFDELLMSLNDWVPSAGSHSPEPSLRIGRSLAGAGGTLIFVTYHPQSETPYGASLLSVGNAIDNVGFAGLQVITDDKETIWRASLRNYSASPQSRTWSVVSGKQVSPPMKASLASGESRTLQGRFPEGADRISIILDADAFPSDDKLFIVRPYPKRLTVSRNTPSCLYKIVAPLFGSLENISEAEGDNLPDFVFSSYNPLQPAGLPDIGVVFLNQEQVPRQFFAGPIIPANQPLMDELDWQGLIARATPSLPLVENENVLLWQGERALILLREEEAREQLIFNFDVIHSNAARQPSFVILIHRFVDQLRRSKKGLEMKNVELHQRLNLAHSKGEDALPLTLTSKNERLSISPDRARFVSAPGAPGFFSVSQGDTLLLDAATNFADTREADFSNASPYSELKSRAQDIREVSTVSDPLWRIWTLILASSALVAWYYLGRSEGVSSQVIS